MGEVTSTDRADRTLCGLQSASDIDLMTVHQKHRQTAIRAWHRLDWVDTPQNVQRREKLEQDL
jgi:hypothetical protein